MAAGLQHMRDKSSFHLLAMLTIETNDQITYELAIYLATTNTYKLFQIKWE